MPANGRTIASILLLLLTCSALASCSTNPTLPAVDVCERFRCSWVQGGEFTHRVAIKSATGSRTTLRVFIENDGTPWLAPNQIALSPQVHRPVAARWFAEDEGPAILLGRPCYHSPPAAQRAECAPEVWTSGRYSSRAIKSMAIALESALGATALSPNQTIKHLIGHSGGGTIAWLLAAYAPANVAWVSTVGANLDVAAWALSRGFTPLPDSLNPAIEPPLSSCVAQQHVRMSDDAIVPPITTERFFRTHGVTSQQRSGGGHECCSSAELLAYLEAHGRANPATGRANRASVAVGCP